MLFFTLLMMLERKAESTCKCRDALEVLVPVELLWGKVAADSKISPEAAAKKTISKLF